MTESVAYNPMSPKLGRQLFWKCCCCIPLKTGCFILGYLTLFLNIFNISVLFVLTTYLGITTHGFDHFDDNQSVNNNQIELSKIAALLVAVICASAVWLLVNIVCLVGLHRRQPGPIRFYVAFASIKVVLSLVWFVYLVMNTEVYQGRVIFYLIDFFLVSYFILLYYSYAVQLERENQQQNDSLSQIIQAKDITFIYPNAVHVDEKKIPL